MTRATALPWLISAFITAGLLWITLLKIPDDIATPIGILLLALGLFRLAVARRTGRRIWVDATGTRSATAAWLWIELGERRTILLNQLIAVALIVAGIGALLRSW